MMKNLKLIMLLFVFTMRCEQRFNTLGPLSVLFTQSLLTNFLGDKEETKSTYYNDLGSHIKKNQLSFLLKMFVKEIFVQLVFNKFDNSKKFSLLCLSNCVINTFCYQASNVFYYYMLNNKMVQKTRTGHLLYHLSAVSRYVMIPSLLSFGMEPIIEKLLNKK